jgi:tape measure domain-containing protein
MATQYAVDLIFQAPKSPALDQLNRQLAELDRKAKSIGGQDPLGGIDRSAKQARAPVAALSASMGGLQAAVAAAAGAFAALGIGLVAREMIQAAGAAQQLAASFTALTGSAATAEKLRDSLFRLSKTTPFKNEDLLQAARGFLAVGVQADKLEGTINRVGALAANSGQDLGRIALVYSQIYAKGRLQGEENLQLLEAGIDIQKELAQVTGLSGTALQDAMSKGKIGVDAVNKALVLATGNMQGLDLAAKSVTIQWQNLGDNAGQVFLGLSKALSPALAAIPGVLNQAFDKMFPDLSTLDRVFAPLLTEAEKFSKLLTDNQEVVDALATAFQSLLNLAIEPAVEGLKQMNRWLEENPDGLVNAVLDVELGLRRSFLVVQSLVEYLTGPGFLAFRGTAKLLSGDIVGAVKDQVAAVQGLGKPTATFGRAVNAQRLTPGSFATPAAQTRAGDLSAKGGAEDAARADTVKKLAELEKDAAKDVRDLNLDYLKDIAEARKQIIKDVQALEKDFARERLESERKLVDSTAALKLQTDIGGLTGNQDERAFRKGLLEETAAFNQKERDRNRSAEDKQRDLSMKLENFKVQVAETIGKINQRYAESYGKIQENYAINSAKILTTAAENMGKIIEAAATNAANTMSSTSMGGASTDFGDQSGNTDFTAQYFRRLSVLESDGGKNWVNPSSGATGFFQFLESTVKDLTRLGINPAGATSRNYNEAAQTAKSYAIAMHPIVKQLLADRDVNGLDRILNRLWTSLPGGAEAASGERLARANALIGGARTPITGGGVYTEGGYGPATRGGANAYDPHFDIARLDGAEFGRAALDAFVKVNGKPLSAGYTVPGPTGGSYGASRDGGARVHRAIDYAFGGGAKMTLAGGAKWTSTSSTDYGDRTVFQTPDGTFYRVIHGKFSGSTAGGGMAAGGTPAAMVTPQLKPLPPRLGPQAGPDLTAEYARLDASQAAIGANTDQTNANLAAADLKRIYEDRANVLRGITEELDKQLKQGEAGAEQEAARLAYLRDGITPALADQFAALDAQTAAMREQLEMQARSYELEAKKLGVSEELKKVYMDLANLARAQAGGLDGQTAARRNQLVQADAAKKDPKNILTQEISDRQAKLDELLNPANQLIAAADSISMAFADAFQGIATGSVTAGQALSQMFKSIGASFIQMAAQMLAQQAALSILKLFGGALGGGGGGTDFGPINLFSGVDWGGAGFRASGGPVDAGRPYITGEEGPELIIPRSAGTVIPARETAAVMARYRPGSNIKDNRGTGSGAATGGEESTARVQYEVTRVNNINYVDEETFRREMAESERRAAARGAEGGYAMVGRDLQNRRSVRSRWGVR